MEKNIRFLYIRLNLFAIYDNEIDKEKIIYTEIDKKDWKCDLQLKYGYDENSFLLNENLAIRRHLTICYDKQNPIEMGIALQSYYDKNHNKKIAREIALKKLKEKPFKINNEEFISLLTSLNYKLHNINEINLKNIYDIFITLESKNLIYNVFKEYMCHKYKNLIIKVVKPKHYNN